MKRLMMIMLLMLCAGLFSGGARATSVPSPYTPVYTCDGGVCAVAYCPDGSVSSIRSCSEAYYNANLRQYFGVLTLKYINLVGYMEIRWSSQYNGDYNSVLGLVSAGQDDPPLERNLGGKNCGACGSPMKGNPINISTGNKFEDELDFHGVGTFPLTFHRFYNSSGFGDGTIGTRWTHTYSRSLVVQNSNEVKLFRDDGEVLYFNKCDSLWCPTVDEEGTLTETVNSNGYITGWTYVDGNVVTEVYDAGGRLISETANSGFKHTLVYDNNGNLSTVADSFGRELTFDYDTSGRIDGLELPDDGLIIYGYDSAGNLSSVAYEDNSSRTYLYDEPGDVASGASSDLLTGIVDENNNRFATFQYDAQSRAIKSEHANGVGIIQVSYNSGGQSAVTDALGASRSYTFQAVQSVNHVQAIGGGYCSSCGQFASYAYNSAGDLTSALDFNGNQTNYVFDSQHLEESRTEASGTVDQRTINTRWDDTLREPLRRTALDASGKLTGRADYWSYNARGQVTARCEVASGTAITSCAMASGSRLVRRWSYAYCDATGVSCPLVGLLLSVDGPRTDVSDVTQYAYYAATDESGCGAPGGACHHLGDLQSVTDALGHVTQ